MFRFLPDFPSAGVGRGDDVPGFRVGQTDDLPGFRVREVNDVPGFRLNPDGSIRTNSSDQYTRVNNASPNAGQSFWSDLVDAAGRVGTRANAVVNGAYSVFPGVYNAGRSVARGTGLLGWDELQRSGQESNAIGEVLTRAAEHPGAALRTVGKGLSILDSDPLFRYYMAGRALMGIATGLGPAAMAGDALRAVEKGHNAFDAFMQGIQGTPEP